MDFVCEVCGAIGFKHLLVQCNNCKDSTRHRYCMDTIVYGPSIEWLCDDCLPKHIGPMESLEAFSNQSEQYHIQLDPSIINGSYVDRVVVIKELPSWGRHRCRSRMANKPTSKHFLNGGAFNSSKVLNGKLSKYNDVEKEARSTNSHLIDSTKYVDGSNHSISIPTSETKERMDVRRETVDFEPHMNSIEGLDLSKEKGYCFPTKHVEELLPQGVNADSFSSINDVEIYRRCVAYNSFPVLSTIEQADSSSHTAEIVEQPHPLEMVKPDGPDHSALDPALETKENLCFENATSSFEPTLNSILPSVEQADGSSHMAESVEQPYPLEVVKPYGSDHSASDPALESKENPGIEIAVDSFEPTLNSMECLEISKEKDSCICLSSVVVGSIPQGMKTDLFPSINDAERSHSSVIGSSPTMQSEEQVDGSYSTLDSWKQPDPLEVIPPSVNMPTSIQGSESMPNYSQLQESSQNIGTDPLNPSEVFLDSMSMSKAIDPSCSSKEQDDSIIEDHPDGTNCVSELDREFIAPAFDNIEGSNLSVGKDCLVSNADISDEVKISDKHLLHATDIREQGQSKVTSHQNISTSEVISTVLNERSRSWKMNENSDPKSAQMGNQLGSNLQDVVQKTSVHAVKNVTRKKALQTEGVNNEVLPPETLRSCKGKVISSEKQQNQPNKPSHLTQNPKSKIRKRQKSKQANDDENALLRVSNGSCAQNDTIKLASQDVVAKDGCSVSRMPVISAHTDQQCNIPTNPIDKPYWTGIMKIGQEYIPLAAHLSNKACKKVLEFSRSLPPVMKVTMHPKLKAWPSRWEESEPSTESIALHFFPYNMRPNKDLDQLVHYVTNNSIVLKYAVGFAKLLIFPSVFLPKEFQLVQGKHYLWGVFRRRKVTSKGDLPLKKQDCISQVATKTKDQQGKVQVDTLDEQMPDPSVEKQDCTSQVAKKRKEKVQVDTLDQQMPDPSVKKQDCTSQVAKKRKDQQYKVQVDTLDQEKLARSQVAKKRKDQQDKVQVDTLDQEKPARSVKKQHCTSQVAKKRNNQQDKVQVDTLDQEKHVTKHNIRNDDQRPPDTVNGVNTETKCGHDGKAQSSSEAPAPMFFGVIDLRTPRSQQLFRELQNEGALVHPVS